MSTKSVYNSRLALTPFSPNDLDLRETGSDIGKQKSDSEDTLALEIIVFVAAEQGTGTQSWSLGSSVP